MSVKLRAGVAPWIGQSLLPSERKNSSPIVVAPARTGAPRLKEPSHAAEEPESVNWTRIYATSDPVCPRVPDPSTPAHGNHKAQGTRKQGNGQTVKWKTQLTEPCFSTKIIHAPAPVAQLDRASDYGCQRGCISLYSTPVTLISVLSNSITSIWFSLPLVYIRSSFCTRNQFI
jgi:hypothetical protein